MRGTFVCESQARRAVRLTAAFHEAALLHEREKLCEIARCAEALWWWFGMPKLHATCCLRPAFEQCACVVYGMLSIWYGPTARSLNTVSMCLARLNQDGQALGWRLVTLEVEPSSAPAALPRMHLPGQVPPTQLVHNSINITHLLPTPYSLEPGVVSTSMLKHVCS